MAPGPVDMESPRPTLTVEPTPTPPVAPVAPREVGRIQASAKKEPANITLTFDQERLPTLIELVYGTILKRNFTVDPAVASRTDLVTLRAGPQTASQVEQTVRLLLKSYGIAVLELGGGTYRIIPDGNLQGYAPEIRRGRALPDVPLPLRPIFQLVELQTVRNADVAGWLRSMFGTKLTIQEDLTRNAVMLSGQADDVVAGIEAVRVLDQPGMKGRQSARINPVYINAELLAIKLSEVMTTEGYSAGTTTQISYPVTFIPIPAINAVIVFAADPSILNHALEWARELDHPSAYRSEPGFFTYQAQNTDAQRLADTLREMLNMPQAASSGGAGAVAAPSAAPPSQGAPAAVAGTQSLASSQASATATGRKIVVNPSTNTLIFKGTNEEYSQVFSLLQDLDKPAKAALIEVTVAEVDLKDAMELGVELNSDMLTSGALTALTGGAGLTVQYLKPGATKAINMITALASQNRAQILSSPRLLARSGETAMIQVGQQVPIVTSQLGSAASSSIFPSSSNLLTSVQYKDVGVILKVKPVIYSGDRIELEVAQEVSDATTTNTGVTTSPTINTKKVETRLALKDGSTVMLGGLISNKESSGNSGVPLLKDLPILGQLFKTDKESNDRQELIILITPYTVLDDHDAQSITEAFRKQLGPWTSYTRPAIPATQQ
ncbi:secretin N-terminal domain-containing protein [Methylomagnum sp.]